MLFLFGILVQWQEVKPKPGALWPSPRSAFQFAVNLDEVGALLSSTRFVCQIWEENDLFNTLDMNTFFQVFMYGGYFKDSAAEIEGSEKGTVLSDMWVLDPRSWVWDKVMYKALSYMWLCLPPNIIGLETMCVVY